MMHKTICAIMHLFVTYQKEFCQLYPVSVYMIYRGVPRSVHSELAVCGYSLPPPPLTVHVAIPVRNDDGKNSCSVKQNRRDKYLSSVEQNGRNCYMVTFQIRTFGRNICNRLTPFMEIVYFLFLLLQTILLDITPRNINYTSQSSLCKL